jgi:hypothetical protein
MKQCFLLQVFAIGILQFTPACIGFLIPTIQGFLVRRKYDLFAAEHDVIDPLIKNQSLYEKLESVEITPSPDLPESPPLSYDKFLTMQDKRVVVTIRYSQGAGLRPYFLTVAKKIKSSHPDVVLERLILPGVLDADEEATFEVLVDGRVVVGKGRSSKQKVGLVDMTHARSVFVSMKELDVAIARSRRKRRPSTAYGGEKSPSGVARKEMLRRLKEGMQGKGE